MKYIKVSSEDVSFELRPILMPVPLAALSDSLITVVRMLNEPAVQGRAEHIKYQWVYIAVNNPGVFPSICKARMRIRSCYAGSCRTCCLFEGLKQLGIVRSEDGPLWKDE